MTYQVEDNDDLEVTGRILETLRDARNIYTTPGNEQSEGWWDGAIDYILYGEERGDGAWVPEYSDADRAAIKTFAPITPEEIDANYAKDLIEDARPSTVHHHTFDRLHSFCRCGDRPENE